MPPASAGILSFFSEESFGLKLRPEIVIGLTIALIIGGILLLWFLSP